MASLFRSNVGKREKNVVNDQTDRRSVQIFMLDDVEAQQPQAERLVEESNEASIVPISFSTQDELSVSEVKTELKTAVTQHRSRNVHLAMALDRDKKCQIHIENEEMRLFQLWEASKTIIVRCFGKQRGAKVAQWYFGSTRKIIVANSFINSSAVIVILGLFDWYSPVVSLVLAAVSTIIIILVIMCAVDTRIAQHSFDLSAISYIGLSILRAVSLCIICEWKNAAVAMMVLTISTSILSTLTDSLPMNIRLRLASYNGATVVIVMVLLQVILVNFGVIPGQVQNAVFLVINTDAAKWPLTVSAYGVFNDSAIATIVLGLDLCMLRYRQPGTLRILAMRFHGLDRPNDFGYPEFN
jgi:hypothetical protein